MVFIVAFNWTVYCPTWMDWIGVTGALWGIWTMQWRSKAELCFLCTQIQKYKYTNLYLKTEAHTGTAVPCRVQRHCCPGALHHALCTMLVSSCYAEAGISSLLNVTSHLVSPVSPNISPRPTSNPVKMQSDVFHFFTTTLSCLSDQMLLLIMDG